MKKGGENPLFLFGWNKIDTSSHIAMATYYNSNEFYANT
jgi:hypothetical protein